MISHGCSTFFIVHIIYVVEMLICHFSEDTKQRMKDAWCIRKQKKLKGNNYEKNISNV